MQNDAYSENTIIIDSDSIFFKICYCTNDFEQACYIFDNKIKSIVETVKEKTKEDWKYVLYFQEKTKTFRKVLYPDYKSNRKTELPPNFKDLKQWVKENHPFKLADKNKETDDLIAEDANQFTCICYIDKDLKQIYKSRFHFNYDKSELYKIDKKEATKNFYTQMIVGDSSDNIKGVKGKGIKYVNNLFKNQENYFYLTLKEYIKYYGTQQGWKRFRLNYELLRLGNLTFIDN